MSSITKNRAEIVSRQIAEVDNKQKQIVQGKSFGQKKKFQVIDKSKVEKQFVIERSTQTEDIFKRMCQEKKKAIQHSKLNRGKMLAYLSRRYKAHVAKRMVAFFDFSTNYEYEAFLEEIENMMNFKKDTLRKLAFNIYDFNQDQYVCELDLYTFIKNYDYRENKEDDPMFFKAFFKDLNKIE